MGVALPELPDDWRADPRHGRGEQPARSRPGTPGPGPAPDGLPADALPGRPWPVDPGSAPRPGDRRPDPGPYDRPGGHPPQGPPTNGYGTNGHGPNGRHAGGPPTNGTGTYGRPGPNGRGPGYGPADRGDDGYGPDGHGHPGAGGRTGGFGAPPGRPVPPPPARTGRQPISDVPPARRPGAVTPSPYGGSDAPTARHAVPRAPGASTTGSTPLDAPAAGGTGRRHAAPDRTGSQPARSARTSPPAPPPSASSPTMSSPPVSSPTMSSPTMSAPARRPAADADPPTVGFTAVPADLPEPPEALPDDEEASEAAPRRHRRRAGDSPDARPGASYRAQAAAAGHKTRGGRRRRPSFWKELPILVVVAFLLTFLIQTFVAKVYVIPSGSMETTLHGCTGCNNDRVLVDKVTYRFGDPRPGDVVVFRGPNGWTSEFTADPPANAFVAALQQLGSLVGLAPPDEKDFIKRVIAVGGQTVQCCDSQNRVMVNGKPLDEPYIYYLPAAGPPRQDSFGPVTVPQGDLWMMGDSRNNSADSRVAGHGPVPISDVIGKARLIVLPFSRFGVIPDPNPQTTAVGMPAAAGIGVLGLVGLLPLAARRRRERAHDRFLPWD